MDHRTIQARGDRRRSVAQLLLIAGSFLSSGQVAWSRIQLRLESLQGWRWTPESLAPTPVTAGPSVLGVKPPSVPCLKLSSSSSLPSSQLSLCTLLKGSPLNFSNSGCSCRVPLKLSLGFSLQGPSSYQDSLHSSQLNPLQCTRINNT